NAAIFAGSYGWSSAGRFHHARTQLHRFLNGFGGFTSQVQNYSYAAAISLLPHVLGSIEAVQGPLSSWDGIAEHTRLMVCFGGVPLKNAQIDSGGIGEHTTEPWLRRCKAAGVQFVTIGPLRDDAADFLEAEWIRPLPNTDTALMLGMAHTLVAEDLYDRDFVARYCVGLNRFLPYLTGENDGQPKDADWAAAICGVPAARIRDLARHMAATRTMLSVAWSLQRGDHGEQPYWMTVVLAALLGQIGLPGGGFGFGYGCEAGMGAPRRRIPTPNLPAGKNPINSSIPVARIADLLLRPSETYDFNGETRTYPDIKIVYWCGGNPFHHHQDLNRLVEAFRRPETVIVHEPWWTATARHADIVLPATTTLERNDIGASPRDRFVMAMHKAVEPVGAARNDHDIFSDLADRLGFRDSFTEGRSEMEWLRHLYDVWRQRVAQHQVEVPSFDQFWERGYVEVPAPDTPYVMFADFRADPAAHPLNTPSGKIEIFSERIAGFGYDDCPGHPMWMEPVEWLGSLKAETYPLHLMSNQPRTRLHSQLDPGSVSRASKIQGREPVWIHPGDAARRDIHTGDVVRIFNERGQVLAGAVVTDLVMPGVVQLATGAWYDPLDPGCRGSLEKHGNANVLTLDKGTSKLAQGPVAHSCLVEIEPWFDTLPPITAFEQPALA
ncbi:MAG: molybdopterin-dependent oxidoreductase, partial [Pseudomonadota bacterium]|nr:molybdopterin-dependent oxidoreductase [Pseudomonadota bacterium]